MKIDYLTINQLIKIDDSSIDYSGKMRVYLKIGFNILHSNVHIENHVPLVIFIDKFNVVFSFQTLRNVDTVYIFFVNDFLIFFFLQNNISPFKHIPSSLFFVTPPD